MASTKIEFRVGLIILLGIAILAGSLYWLQSYKLRSDTQKIKVRFQDVGTLSVGDRVTVSGVRKGKVDRLQLTDKGVLVTLLVGGDVQLHSDAKFVIRNLGLMGERFIAIWPGDDTTRFHTDSVATGEYDPGLPDVMGKLGEIVTELRSLMQAFRQSIGSESTMVQLNRTVTNLESVSEGMSDYLARNRNKLDSTAENFYQAASKINKILSRNSGNIDSTVTRFNRSSAKLENLTYQLDTLAGAARQFADKINNPDGTLQLLLEDRRLYDDLRMTADNLDDLVTDIKENPRKYINLKVEIF